MRGTGQESYILRALALVAGSPVIYQRDSALLAILEMKLLPAKHSRAMGGAGLHRFLRISVANGGSSAKASVFKIKSPSLAIRNIL